MKIVIFVIAVLVLLWLLRRGGPARSDAPPRPQAPKALPQRMVACAQCGVHLPASEALPGRGGDFCSEAHRQSFEQVHRGP